MEGVFPLWGRDTRDLASRMMADGVVAHIACLDPTKVDRKLAGHVFDQSLLVALGRGVDPCGENGEFHTLVSGGPFFHRPLDLTPDFSVEREGFVFKDFSLKSKKVGDDKGATIG